jgi:hypothetical protein
MWPWAPIGAKARGSSGAGVDADEEDEDAAGGAIDDAADDDDDDVARAEMTLPSDSSPWLIRMLSLKRVPTAPVRFARSDPARSTRWNLARRHVISAPALTSAVAPSSWRPPEHRYSLLSSRWRVVFSRRMVKMACEREDFSFIRVLPVVRSAVPCHVRPAASLSRESYQRPVAAAAAGGASHKIGQTSLRCTHPRFTPVLLIILIILILLNNHHQHRCCLRPACCLAPGVGAR